MPIDRNTVLYFFSQPGCPHCAMARPVVDAIRRKYLGQIMVLELNVDLHPGIDDYKVKATPAYVVKRSGFVVATKEGGLNEAQLEKLIGSELHVPNPRPPGVKRKAKPKVKGPVPELDDDEPDEPEVEA